MEETLGILCDKRIPSYLKSAIYETVVRFVVLYLSETMPAYDENGHDTLVA